MLEWNTLEARKCSELWRLVFRGQTTYIKITSNQWKYVCTIISIFRQSQLAQRWILNEGNIANAIFWLVFWLFPARILLILSVISDKIISLLFLSISSPIPFPLYPFLFICLVVSYKLPSFIIFNTHLFYFYILLFFRTLQMRYL